MTERLEQMMIYLPNHGPINTNFGSNPFDNGPTEYSQGIEDDEYTPIKYLMIPAHPHLDLQKNWGEPNGTDY